MRLPAKIVEVTDNDVAIDLNRLWQQDIDLQDQVVDFS